MRRSPISQATEAEEEISLTPMLDVVFILLIFFIVTARIYGTGNNQLGIFFWGLL